MTMTHSGVISQGACESFSWDPEECLFHHENLEEVVN